LPKSSQNNRKFNVLLAAMADWMGLVRLISVLYQAGCLVTVLTRPGNYLAHSRYAHRVIPTPEDLLGLVDCLETHLDTVETPYDWVIAGDDLILYQLADRRKEPWVDQVFPVDAQGAGVDFLINKYVFPTMAAKVGIPVPQTELLTNRQHALGIAGKLNYPVISKQISGYSGFSVCIVHSREEYEAMFPKKEGPIQLVIQEFVFGRIGTATALYNHGKLLGWVAFFVEKTHPSPCGPSTSLQFAHLPQLQPILETLGELHGFHGFSGIDFIRIAKTGEVKVLEQHARPTPQVYLGKQAGVDFAPLVRAMLMGQQPEAIQSQRPGLKRVVYGFPQDVHRCIAQRDFKGLLKWLFPTRWREFPLHDPQVMAMYCRDLYKHLRNEKWLLSRRNSPTNLSDTLENKIPEQVI
jgi:predicted ATP-grasp superfamily ATP-dependent carboligase